MTCHPIARLSWRDRQLLLALREHALLGFSSGDIIPCIDDKLAAAPLQLAGKLDDHVQIGSRFVYSAAQHSRQWTRLVLSARKVTGSDDLILTSPLGMAALGMPEGSVVAVAQIGLTLWIHEVLPPAPVSAEMATSLDAFADPAASHRLL